MTPISNSCSRNGCTDTRVHEQSDRLKALLQLQEPRVRVFTELARQLTGGASAFVSVRWRDTFWTRGLTLSSSQPATMVSAHRLPLERQCNPSEDANICITADKEGAAYLCVTGVQPKKTYTSDIQHQLFAVAGAIAQLALEMQTDRALRFQYAIDHRSNLPSIDLTVQRLSHILRLAASIGWRGSVIVIKFRDLDRLRSARGLRIEAQTKEVAAQRIRSVLPNMHQVGVGVDDDSLLAFAFSSAPDRHDYSGTTPCELGARVLNAVEAFDVPGVGIQRLNPQIGISLFPDNQEQTADNLIARAEDALDAGQSTNRRVEVYDSSVRTAAQQALDMENRLRAALAEQRFTVFFQVKVDAISEDVIGAEALLRWREDDLGSVSPGVFLPIAQRLGLMPEIDNFVLEQACAAATRWGSLPNGRQPSVAVNLTPINLEKKGFFNEIQRILTRTGLPPERLILELTEDTLPVEYRAADDVMRALAVLGVRFAIDDFGTGYSNLSHIQNLPFRSLKLDRTFVADIEHDERGEQLVESMIAMATALGLSVVAEGVETRTQARRLKALGCHQFQGFLFGHPVPESEFSQLFNRNHQGYSRT